VDRIPAQGLWPDLMLEIEPVRLNGANAVWEWHVFDHLIQSHDPGAASFGDPAAQPGRIDLNAGAHAPAIDAAQLEQLEASTTTSPSWLASASGWIRTRRASSTAPSPSRH
jgi:hypothetical protein